MASKKIETLIKEIEAEAVQRCIADPSAFGVMIFGMPIANVAALREFFYKNTGIDVHQLTTMSPQEIRDAKCLFRS